MLQRAIPEQWQYILKLLGLFLSLPFKIPPEILNLFYCVLFKIYFMHVGVLPVCLHHMHAKGSQRTEEGVGSQSGVRVGYEPDPPWCWKSR